jgi:hypothetical protein
MPPVIHSPRHEGWDLLIGGLEFVHASSIEAARDERGRVLLDQPHVRFANSRSLPLLADGRGPFARLKLSRLPQTPGVYAVIQGGADIMYIGRARTTFADRWGSNGYGAIRPRNCFRGGQSTNCHVNRLIADALVADRALDLLIHPTQNSVMIEHHLIRHVSPPWNRQLL